MPTDWIVSDYLAILPSHGILQSTCSSPTSTAFAAVPSLNTIWLTTSQMQAQSTLEPLQRLRRPRTRLDALIRGVL